SVAPLWRVARGRERLLKQVVEVSRTGRAAVHRSEHLDVPWVQCEPTGDPIGDDVDDLLGGDLGIVGRKQEEVGVFAEDGGAARVDPVGVDDHTGLLCLPEDGGESDAGQRVGGEQVPQDFTRADRGELVDVADQQQVSSGSDRLDELVGEDEVQHGNLVHDDQVGVDRVVRVVDGITTRA